MVEVAVKISEDVTRMASKYAQRAPAIYRKAAMQAGEHVSGEIRKSIAAWVSGTDGVKTGSLMRSFRPTFKQDANGSMRVIVASDLPYARIHEYGGTITAKNARALTIPLTKEARRRNARSFNDLFILRFGGNAFLAQRIGKRGRLKFQYVLKRSVRISAKKYLSKASAAAAPGVNTILRRGIADIIRTTRVA